MTETRHSTPPARVSVKPKETPPPSSLPPQHRTHPLLTLVIWLVVVGVILVGGYFAYQYYVKTTQSANAKAGKGERPAPVLFNVAKSESFPVYISAVATVQAYNTVSVHTRIDGQIMKVAFTEGQHVKEGDLLVQIDPRPYEVMLTQAVGQLAKDQATLDNAQLDLKRYQSAAEAVSQQQVDTAKATVESSIGAVKTDQGMIDAAKLNIEYCRITSPLTGVIGLRMVDEGNIVHAADTNAMAVVTQVQPIAVIFSPREDDLPRIMKAMARNPKLPVEAWDHQYLTKLSQGAVDAIDNQIDPLSLTFKIKARFENQDNALYPNQAVNVKLLVDTVDNAVVVPSAAVQQSPDNSYFIYVLKDDNTVEQRPVTVGMAGDATLSENDRTVIATGLAAGEKVVTDGVNKLEPGSKVVPHDANAPTTASGTNPATQHSGKKGSKAGKPAEAPASATGQ